MELKSDDAIGLAKSVSGSCAEANVPRVFKIVCGDIRSECQRKKQLLMRLGLNMLFRLQYPEKESRARLCTGHNSLNRVGAGANYGFDSDNLLGGVCRGTFCNCGCCRWFAPVGLY